MINFEREEADLAASVGVSADAIAAASEVSLAPIRDRYRALAETATSQAERLERDRLDSLVTQLYGKKGWLMQAGALLACETRLTKASAIASGCRTAEIAGRLRREGLILSTFARARAKEIAAAVDATAHALKAVDDFWANAEVIDRQVGLARRARLITLGADVADDWPQSKTLGDMVTIALNQLAHGAWHDSARVEYDRLCHEHAAALRDALWASAEAGGVDGIVDLTQLDLTLEALRKKLADPKLDGAARCTAIGELYAQIAASRAAHAAAKARELLGPMLGLIKAGVEAEVRK